VPRLSLAPIPLHEGQSFIAEVPTLTRTWRTSIATTTKGLINHLTTMELSLNKIEILLWVFVSQIECTLEKRIYNPAARCLVSQSGTPNTSKC